MTARGWTAFIGAVAVLAAAVPSVAAAERTAGTEAPVEPAVVNELAQAATTDFWVVFEDRADVGAADEIRDWSERGRYVYDRLVKTGRDSQADLVAELTARGVDFEPFWIANRVLVRAGDRQTLNTARAQDGVLEIQADEPVELPRPIEGTEADAARSGAVEWGIENIRADRVWSELGVRGKDIVVGNIDSGVQFTHPALVNQYRGNRGDGTFDHNYGWWDPSRACPAAQPCDNSGHGTHTMGTMVGDDGAGHHIGVAPMARWIAAKGCESTTCSFAALLSAGQFMLAPTNLAGANPRPELRPHVVNNSWGGGGGRDFYDAMVEAWTAAGMFPVFSNGNTGPACGTAGSPADAPGGYSVGAHDSDNAIAGFSARGPGRDREIKPNLAAPGVNVRSSVPGDGYRSFNGTSMAAPHLAGTVALMWSAASQLVGDIGATRAALDGTATDTEDLTCGGTPANNNVFGQGRLDALGATLRAVADTGVGGRITDAASGLAIANVQVRVLDDGRPMSTASGVDGRYRLNLLPGRYDVEILRFGYQPLIIPGVDVREGEITTLDGPLKALPTGTVTGKVTLDKSGRGVPGVTIDGGNVPLTTTGADGTFRVDAPIGTYDVVARSGMFPATEPQAVTVTDGASVVVDFVLRCGEKCDIEGLWTDRYDGSASSSDISRELVVSPDGATMFVTGESPGSGTGVDMVTVAVETATGTRRWEARHNGAANRTDAGYGLGISPDGSTVYVAGPSTGAGGRTQYAVVAYDAATGKQRWAAHYDGPGTGDDAALALDVSPDGSAVFVTGLSDDVWNDYATVAFKTATGERLWVARYNGPANTTDTAVAVSVAPDGATVHVTGYSRPASGVANDFDYATVTYKAATGKELWVARYSGPTAGGADVAQDLRVSPDSSKVFVTGYSPGPNSNDYATIAYDRATGAKLWVARYNGPAGGADVGFALDVHPGGSTVYVTGRSAGIGTGDDYATVAYDAATGERRWLRRFDGSSSDLDVAQALEVSPDGSAVYVSGQSAGVGTNADYGTVGYDAASGADLWQARYNGPRDGFDSAGALRVSPDSSRVYVTGFSFGAGTSRDYATVSYDAKANPRRPVFVPWGLQVQPDVVLSAEKVGVGVKVTNVGTAAGAYDASLTANGNVLGTLRVTLEPGATSPVDWSTQLDEPGRYSIGVGHLAAPLWVVGCDQTVTGTHRGPLTVTKGVTCLAEGAQVTGPVHVRAGAGLVSTGATVNGMVSADDAAVVALRDSRFSGPITITGATGGLVLSDNQVTGNVRLDDNTSDGFALVVAGNRIAGMLSCTGNTPPPVNQGVPNEVTGQQTAQCADL